MSKFATRIDPFLADFYRLNPTWATGIGVHQFDDRWPDLTEAGRAERLGFTDRWLGEFRAMTGLHGDEAIDRDLLIGELEAARFTETELREETWNPLDWVYLLGDGLFSLLAREFAPLEIRLASVAGRLEGLPGVVEAAKVRSGWTRRAAGRSFPDRDGPEAAAGRGGVDRRRASGCRPGPRTTRRLRPWRPD